MDERLKKLEEIRMESETYFPGVIMTAMTDGKEMIGLLNDTDYDHQTVKEYLDKGYWVVNNFRNGKPLGLGF